jgi:hypothetical protein
MSNIRTYEDLQEMKHRLEAELVIRREVIKEDVAALKREWKPVMDLVSGFSDMPAKMKAHPILSMGIGLLGEVVIKNFLLARAGWISKLILPVLATNFSSHILNKDGTSIFSRLFDRFKNRNSNGRHIIEHE